MKTDTLFQMVASTAEQVTAVQESNGFGKTALSLYQPVTAKRSTFETQLNSLLSELLRDEIGLDDAARKQIKAHLTQLLIQQRDEHKDWAKHLALFAVLDTEHAHTKDPKQIIPSANIISLPEEVERFAQIDYMFEMRPAVKSLQQHQDTLILHLEEDFARIYDLQAKQLRTLTTIENPYISARDERYIEKGTAGPQKAFYFGTGDRSIEATQEAGDKHFLQGMVVDELAALLDDHDWEQVVVLYSERFSDFISAALEHGIKPHTNALISARSVHVMADTQDTKELTQFVQQHGAEMQHQHMQELLAAAQEDHARFVDEWKDVVAAARDGALQHLFITRQAQHEGLVGEAGLIYDAHEELEPEARPTARLGTALSWRALEIDAALHVLDPETEWFESEVAGVLRYVS